MSKQKVNEILERKNQSMKDHNENSLDSHTGYMDQGNDSMSHAKARVMRNGDNGSHL
jgi:hypothetical protein